jgi:hypothetical protein
MTVRTLNGKSHELGGINVELIYEHTVVGAAISVDYNAHSGGNGAG